VDQVQVYEQRHLYQRSLITTQLKGATHPTLQQWLEGLTQDFLEVRRLADSMRYRLSASVPYDSIVQNNLQVLQEQALPFGQTITDYIRWKITGVVDGYQQLLTRIHALNKILKERLRYFELRSNWHGKNKIFSSKIKTRTCLPALIKPQKAKPFCNKPLKDYP